jgi:phasin family protein
MTSLPQFSAARIPQSQLEFFRAVTAQAFTNTERLLMLNVRTTRESIERSSNTIKQLFSVNDPRDLLTITSQTQQEFQSLLSYSRELFGIMTQAGLKPPADAPAAAAAAPTLSSVPARAPAPAAVQPAASEPTVDEAIAQQMAKAAKAPEVAADAPAAAPAGQAKPVAKALSQVAPQSASSAHPLAAPVAAQHEIELPQVKPVVAAPPPATSTGPAVAAKKAEAAPKAARKK